MENLDLKIKQIYYFQELQNFASYRQPEKIKAKNLVCAQRAANKRACFYNTVLKLFSDPECENLICFKITDRNSYNYCKGWQQGD